MKTNIYACFALAVLFTAASCDKERVEPEVAAPQPAVRATGIPEGYFVVDFSGAGQTKAAISGTDPRVQHIRYVIYKQTGEFVKEKLVPLPFVWPIASIKDTLPRGEYRAVFLGNAEKTLFPIGTTPDYAEVLTNYKTTYADARIVLPGAEFSDNSEYYFGNISFSDASPNPTVLMQRIIGATQLHRELIGAQDALDLLVGNIMTNIWNENTVETTVRGLLGTNLGGLNIAALNGILSPLTSAIAKPLTDSLYQRLLKGLTHQIGMALAGNTDQAALLANIGELLNPWASLQSDAAVVTINNFPKSINFDLAVQETFAGAQPFRFNFTTVNPYTQKNIMIKGFGGNFDIQQVDVAPVGLVKGLVLGTVTDNMLLPGSLIDINDQLAAPVAVNRRYKSVYTVADLDLKQPYKPGNQLNLTVRLGNVANLDDALSALLIPPLDAIVLALIDDISITLPISLPLIGTNQLTISGGWSPLAEY